MALGAAVHGPEDPYREWSTYNHRSQRKSQPDPDRFPSSLGRILGRDGCQGIKKLKNLNFVVIQNMPALAGLHIYHSSAFFEVKTTILAYLTIDATFF